MFARASRLCRGAVHAVSSIIVFENGFSSKCDRYSWFFRVDPSSQLGPAGLARSHGQKRHPPTARATIRAWLYNIDKQHARALTRTCLSWWLVLTCWAVKLLQEMVEGTGQSMDFKSYVFIKTITGINWFIQIHFNNLNHSNLIYDRKII